MGDQIIVNDYGMFRADAWDELKKERERVIERRKQMKRVDSYTNRQRVFDFVHYQQNKGRLDASQTEIVARQLLYTMQQLKEISYPGDILEQAFPINTEAGPGVDSIAYQELDFNGEFRLLASAGTDLPEIGSSLSETPKKVGVYGAYIGWSLEDLERAGFSGTPIQQRKQRAAVLAAQKIKNTIAWNGDPQGAPIDGLFSYALNDASLSGSWSNADDALTDMLKLIDTPEKDTEDFPGDTLVSDTTSFTFMNKPRSANVDTSVGRYILQNTGIRSILKTSRLNSVTSAVNSLSNNRVILCYPRNSMVLEFMLPRDLQMLPMQQHMLQYVVPMVMNCAGVFLYKGGANGPVAFGTP
jgi:hypothetical protein